MSASKQPGGRKTSGRKGMAKAEVPAAGQVRPAPQAQPTGFETKTEPPVSRIVPPRAPERLPLKPWAAKPWMPGTTTAFSYQAPDPVPADLVSICVTNYNYADHLPDCLASLVAQTHPSLDLIIVDDHSTRDDSIRVAVEWLSEHAKRFHRATLLSQNRNQGVSVARNTAFDHAISEYVFVIDADNDAFPRAIARLYRAIRDGGFDATYSQLVEYGDRVGIGRADIWDPVELVRNNYVDVMSIVLKSAWKRIGGYSHIDEGWEDYDFWLKFVDAGLLAGYVPEILCRYRVHGKSRTATEAAAAHHKLKRIMALRHPPLLEPDENAPKT